MSGVRKNEQSEGKENKMIEQSIITRRKMTIGEAKDVENALANVEKYNAFMEYIAICDHPEMFEDEMEVEE